MAKRKRGRPRLSPDGRRSERLGVTFTPAEADRVHRFALRHNLPTTAVIRAAVALMLERRESPR